MTRGIQVPVTIGFDRHRAIGTLLVDADLLPPEGNFMFSIAGTVTPRKGVKTFELAEITVLSDADVLKVLQAKQKPGGGK
jgi:hypothetical protein